MQMLDFTRFYAFSTQAVLGVGQGVDDNAVLSGVNAGFATGALTI